MTFKSSLLIVASVFALSACDQAIVASSGAVSEAETVSAVEAQALPELGHSAADFFNTTSYSIGGGGGYAFSQQSGDILISSDETGVFNAYALNPQTGDTRALTQRATRPLP